MCSKLAENQKPVIFSRKAAKFAKVKMMKNVNKKSLRLCAFARGFSQVDPGWAIGLYVVKLIKHSPFYVNLG